jgi:hypothetical protein
VIDWSGRRPALLRQHRHGYAAALHRGLLAAGTRRLRSRPPRHAWGACAADRPISTRLEPASLLRSFDHWFAHAAPSDLARQARTVWQSRHASPSSGPFATHHRRPRQSAAPQLHSGRCDGPKGTVSHHLSINPAPRGAQLGREESRRGLQNSVAPAQFGVFLALASSTQQTLQSWFRAVSRHRPRPGAPTCAPSRQYRPEQPGNLTDRRPLRGRADN